jgi:hypothetical protein
MDSQNESDYSSSDTEGLDTSAFQKLLHKLHDELTESILDMYALMKQLKPDSFTKKRVLTKDAQDIFKRKMASLKDLLDFWMPLWKEEGRIHGRNIRLGAEALLLGFMEESQQDVYDVCKRMCRLFD